MLTASPATVPVQEQPQDPVESSAAPAETPAAGTGPSQQQEQEQQQQQQDTSIDSGVQTEAKPEVPPVADSESGPAPKTEPESPVAADQDIEIIEFSQANNFDGPKPLVPVTSSPGQSKPAPSAAAANSNDKQTPPLPFHEKPKPYYPDNVQTVVKFGANVPMFMDFFQPFNQALQPFPQSFQPLFQANYNQPPRHQQPQPYGASVDPFDPFANSMRSPFNQLVEAYTNEFRSKTSP